MLLFVELFGTGVGEEFLGELKLFLLVLLVEVAPGDEGLGELRLSLLELSVGAEGEAVEFFLVFTGGVDGEAPEVLLVDLLDGVTAVDEEAALLDCLDEDGGGVCDAVSLALLLGVRGDDVDLSFEVDRPSGDVDAFRLEVLLLVGTSSAASFSEASSSSSVDSARPSSGFLSTTFTSTCLPTTSNSPSVSLTSGSTSPPSLSLSLIVDSLWGAPKVN